MTAPRRIQLRRAMGWRKPPGAVTVARPSKWGNPYAVADYGRDEAIRLYRDVPRPAPRTHSRARTELAGRDLACWCAPSEACHADVLLAVANGQPP